MTKSDLVKQNHYLRRCGSFDYALPLHWINIMREQNGIPNHVLIQNFVWLYDEKSPIFGRPYPLNMAGWVACYLGGIEWT